MKARRGNRGFTLAETVVAMAVILMITVSAVSSVAYGVSLSQRNRDSIFFAMETENLLQCYLGDGLKIGEGSLVEFHFGATPAEEEGVLSFRYDGSRRPTEGEWKYEIEVRVTTEGFFAVAMRRDGRELYRMKNYVLRAESKGIDAA